MRIPSRLNLNRLTKLLCVNAANVYDRVWNLTGWYGNETVMIWELDWNGMGTRLKWHENETRMVWEPDSYSVEMRLLPYAYQIWSVW